MTTQTVIRSVSLMLVCVTALTAEAADPLLTNQTSFNIPFVVETSDGSAAAGTALLFTSVNEGPMEQTQRVPAAAGEFHFTAPADGTYAFAVRMTDAAGQMLDTTSPLVGELKVQVDTASPELQIQLTEVSSGVVNVAWKCDDAQVAPGSIRLEYAEGADGRWKPIDGTNESSGQVTIETLAATSVSVRGFLTDLAGNQGTASSQMVLTNPATTTKTSQPETQTAMNNASVDSGFPVSAAALPTEALGASPFVGQPSPNANPVSSTNTMSIPPNVVLPESAPQTPFPQQPMMQASPPPAFAANPQPFSPAPPMEMMNPGQDYVGGPAAKLTINNRIFDIEYAVEGVGPSGVGAVELFVTENNGQQWFRYGTDADLQSPFQVDSRGEGTFGFAVRVRNGLGFSDPPPQPGEQPSIVVVVDQTPPVATLGQAKVVFDRRGRIRIPWQVTDANPASNGVRLEYAVSASGPWTPVFDWQPDTGGHEMLLQPGLPNALYFRLLARDAAGNIGTAQSPRPILVDQRRPTARLLRVQPVSRVGTY